MQLRYGIAGLYPDEAVRCINFLAQLSERTYRCAVHIEGQRAFTFANDYEIDDELMGVLALADDLKVIQGNLNRRFKMPTRYSESDRIDIRVARAVLEGYFVESPGAVNFNRDVKPADFDMAELDRILSDGLSVDVAVNDFSLTVGDHVLPIDNVRAMAVRAKLLNGAELREAVEAGQSEPFRSIMRPVGHHYFLVYKNDRIPESRDDWQQAWWTLPGIVQPDGPSE